jgi:hypothetical protein
MRRIPKLQLERISLKIGKSQIRSDLLIQRPDLFSILDGCVNNYGIDQTDPFVE